MGPVGSESYSNELPSMNYFARWGYVESLCQFIDHIPLICITTSRNTGRKNTKVIMTYLYVTETVLPGKSFKWNIHSEPDYMVSFSPGWNFFFRLPDWNIVVITCSISAQGGRKTQNSERKFTEVRKHSQCTCSRFFFSARAEIPFRLHEILARFENTGLGFSARTELRPGLNLSPCNRQFGFQRICFRSRAEMSARDEIRHVIRP